MNITIMMIITESNYYESIVTLYSVLEQKNWNEKYNLILVTSKISNRNKKKLKLLFEDKANCEILKDNDLQSEDDILNYDLRKIRVINGNIIFLQSKVFIRKSISYLLKNYSNENKALSAAITIPRGIKNDNFQKCNIDLGLIIINMDKIRGKSYKISTFCGENNFDIISLEDYFYLHPTISTNEVNTFFNSAYMNFDTVEASAVVVRMFSSIETRIRGNNIICREWSSYLKEIPGAVSFFLDNNNFIKSQFKIINKKSNSLGTCYYFCNIPILQKKYCSGGYKIKLFKLTIYKSIINSFYVKAYFLGVRISKELNYGLIDSLLTEKFNKLANDINLMNVRMNDLYCSKNAEKLENEEINLDILYSKIKGLRVYNVFKRLQDGEILREDEIRSGDLYINEVNRKK